MKKWKALTALEELKLTPRGVSFKIWNWILLTWIYIYIYLSLSLSLSLSLRSIVYMLVADRRMLYQQQNLKFQMDMIPAQWYNPMELVAATKCPTPRELAPSVHLPQCHGTQEICAETDSNMCLIVGHGTVYFKRRFYWGGGDDEPVGSWFLLLFQHTQIAPISSGTQTRKNELLA